MRRVRALSALVVSACAPALAAGPEFRPAGPPRLAGSMGSAPETPSQTAEVRRLPGALSEVTVDAITGATAFGPPGVRGNRVLYDNTVNDAGLSMNVSGRSEFGDTLRMINGGRLERVTFTIFNADGINTLQRGDLGVRFRDPRAPHAVIGEFTLVNFDFASAGQPDGLPPLHGLIITVSSLGVRNIVLPAVVLAGWKIDNPVGVPGPPTMLGQAVFGPPVVGSSFDQIWERNSNGTFLYYSLGSPGANLSYRIEVSSVANIPPPVYVNVAASAQGVSTALGAFVGDDLDMLAGGILERVAFSVFNGSATTTLQTVDVDAEFRNWDPVGGTYVPGDVLRVRDAAVNVPPGAWRPFVLDNLTSYRIVVTRDVLAGLTFSNPNPVTINRIGQAVAGPPTVGGSEQRWWGPLPPPAPIPDFYWQVDVFHPLPCWFPGDMNCDDQVNNLDIDGFMLALLVPEEYARRYPDCDVLCGDFTGDGALNNLDINAFTDCFLHDNCP